MGRYLAARAVIWGWPRAEQVCGAPGQTEMICNL